MPLSKTNEPVERHLSNGEVVRLIAETDDALAWWRTQTGHAYRQLWIDAYLRRRTSLTKVLKRPLAGTRRLAAALA